jgi:hypothetical protein
MTIEGAIAMKCGRSSGDVPYSSVTRNWLGARATELLSNCGLRSPCERFELKKLERKELL